MENEIHREIKEKNEKPQLKHAQKIIIQKLFDEQLFPGGSESYTGAQAAEKIGKMNNPYALPLMLRHIQTYGPGSTDVVVLKEMRHILKNSNRESLDETLKSLPENTRSILQALTDEKSYLKRLSANDYDTCNLLKNENILKQEKYTKILDGAGLSEEELNDFYHLSPNNLLGQVKKIAEITGQDKKTLIKDYYNELTSNISLNNKNSARIIKELSTELDQPAKDIFTSLKDKFNSKSNNPLHSIKILKEIASLIDIDKKDLIEQHLSQLTPAIKFDRRSSIDIVKKIAKEINKPSEEIIGKKIINELKAERLLNAIKIKKNFSITDEFMKSEKVIKTIEEISDDLLNKFRSGDIDEAEGLKKICELSDGAITFNKFQEAAKDGLITKIKEGNIEKVTEIKKIFSFPDEFIKSEKTKKIIKDGFLNSLKRTETPMALDAKKEFDINLSSQELIDNNEEIKNLLLEFQKFSPEFYNQALKSPDIIIPLYTLIQNPQRAIDIAKDNPFLIKAVSENPRYGAKLLLKYSDFDRESKENIKFMHLTKDEILKEKPGIDPRSLEFRMAMQEKLKKYKNNEKILEKMKSLDIDTDKWLNYNEKETFILTSSENKNTFPEIIATPVNRIRETVDSYTNKIKDAIKDYEKELVEHRTSFNDISELTPLIKNLRQIQHESQNEKKTQTIENQIIHLEEKIKSAKEMSSWDKITRDIKMIEKFKNNFTSSYKKIVNLENKHKKLITDNSRSPTNIMEIKQMRSKSKEDIKEKFKSLTQNLENFRTSLPSILEEALGQELSKSLTKKIETGLEEQFNHYLIDKSELSANFSEKTDKEKNRLKGRPMKISVWSRDPDIDNYQGNYTGCCISIESGHPGHSDESTILDLETDLGIQIVNIWDEVKKEPITAAWCWLGEDGELKPAFVTDNIESNTLYSANFSDQLTDKLFEYLKKYSAAIRVGKTVLGEKNNDLPTEARQEKMKSDKKTYTKIGGFNREKSYHLEAENQKVKTIQ